MISTLEFVTLLRSVDLTRSDTLIVDQVDFDAIAFANLIQETQFHIVPNSEGKVSVVKQGSDTRDFSRSARDFDYHTDGLYKPHLPQFVLLFCQNPGKGETTTRLSDGVLAWKQLKNETTSTILKHLDTVYIGKNGEQYYQPLVQSHPLTGEHTLILGSRAYFVPRYLKEDTGNLPTARDLITAGTYLFQSIDHSLTHEQTWKEGDLLLFDNYRFIHRRHTLAPDVERQLLRIWLSIDGVSAQHLCASRTALT